MKNKKHELRNNCRNLKKDLFLFFLIILSISLIEALDFNWKYIPDGKSNESIQAKNFILDGEKCIEEMQNKNINVSRANESLQQAIQLYYAEITLEEKKVGSVQYDMVNQPAKEVCNIKRISFQAQDELILFMQKWELDSETFNLSSINKEYEKIINSFNEERFEDTIELINQGYDTLAEFESSQTGITLFYETTTKNIKAFLIQNWEILSISIITPILLLLLFWKRIKRGAINKKLEGFSQRKYAIEKLMKRTQWDYFNKKTMSETEYRVKIKTFGEMMMEINKKIPELHEELAKMNRKEVPIKKKKEIKVKEKIKKKIEKIKKKLEDKKPKIESKPNKKSKFKKKGR